MDRKGRVQFAAKLAAGFAGLLVAVMVVRRLLGEPTMGWLSGIATSCAIGASIGAMTYAYQAWIARHPRSKL